MVATEQHSLPELQTLMDSNELDATTGLSYQRAPMMNYDLLTAGEPTTFFDESFYEDTALSADDLCNFFEDGSCWLSALRAFPSLLQKIKDLSKVLR